MDFKYVKIVVFVPTTHADELRKVLAESGAGKIGNYDSCSFSAKGIGRFRPLKESKPAIGSVDRLEVVEEEKIEVICEFSKKEDVLKTVFAAHPYEEPAIDIYPLLNE